MDAFRAENTRLVVLAEATPVQCALNTHRIFKMESNKSLIRLALGPEYLNIMCCPPPLSTNFGVVSDYQTIEFGYLLEGDKSNKALVFARG